jgi:hypothetical protein
MNHTFEQGDWVTWRHYEKCLVVWAFERDAIIKLYDMDAFIRVYLDDLTLEEVGSLDNVKHIIDWLTSSITDHDP